MEVIIEIPQFEDLTLEEIKLSNNQEYLLEYKNIINSLSKGTIIEKRVLEKNPGQSINCLFQKIAEEEQYYQSYILFPGSKIMMYPSIKEHKTKKFITCDFSGARIYPGSLYVNYQSLLINLESQEKYVLKKPLKVETGYFGLLPRNIGELETLLNNMTNELENDDGVDYTHFNRVMGGDLAFQKLKRRR